MNAILSAAGGWVVALAIAVPIIILFWWARRNAPVGDYELDYSVGRRARPPLDTLAPLPAPAAHGAVDAPILANPAVLAPPTETAAAPASTVALPAQAPLPPEPPGVLTPAPAKPAEPPVAAHPAPATPALVTPATPKPTPAPAAKPAAAAAPKAEAPAPVKAAEPAPKPKPVAPPPAPKPVLEKPAPAPEAPQPTPAPAAPSAPAASVAEPTGESDDFTRLYGPDAAAIAALHAAGIVTYRQLAAASIDSLKEILANGGASGVDPSTWPQQGRFAAGGKWKQLDARFKG